MENIRVHGFGICGFRSFSGPEQRLGPFKKINIFIGQNNSGKSNVLRYIRKVYCPIVSRNRSANLAMTDSDRPKTSTEAEQPYFSILLPVDDASLNSVFSQEHKGNATAISEAKAAFGKSYATAPPDFTWIPVTKDGALSVFEAKLPFDEVDQMSARNTWIRMTGQSGGNLRQHWFPEICSQYVRSFQHPSSVVFIKTSRKIPTRQQEFSDEYDLIGSGTACEIDTLATWKDPEANAEADLAKFEAVQHFLCTVLERDVQLSVSSSKTAIFVHEFGRRVQIEALGTGVHQLVIFAIQALMHENSVVCIEEPELHLHPELQRKLMVFFAEKTSNQYFVTTHSAHVMDAVECAIFHVELTDGRSIVSESAATRERHNICRDLGYRPSDLLQANSVIWVEGPSDRIYLLWWLGNIAPEIEEGRHFSIMFYGGRLLSHLSFEDAQDGQLLEELIDVLPINRRSCVVIDRDCDSLDVVVNQTKLRVIAECERLSGFCWLTGGREIENYIESTLRDGAIKSLYGDDARINAKDKNFGSALGYTVGSPKRKRTADKVRVARLLVAGTPNLDVLDLRERLNGLIEFIRSANGQIKKK